MSETIELSKIEMVGLNGVKNITFVSGPVIFNNNRVLLVRKFESDKWQFPGGTCNSNENFEETAIREASEELKIKIEVSGKPFVHGLQLNDKMYMLIHYEAKIISGEPTPSEEIEEFMWADINGLDSVKLFDNVRTGTQFFYKI